MNKGTTSLLAFLFGLSVFAHGQTKTGVIKGRIVDEKGNGIVSAFISLIKGSDSSVVKISPSGKSGEFAFENIPVDNYAVHVSSVGYSKFYSDQIMLSSGQPSVEIKPIALSPQSSDLKAVTVVSRKPFRAKDRPYSY